MKSASSTPKQSGSKAALNRSTASLADASEAAKIAAHAASHAQPKCTQRGLMISASSHMTVLRGIGLINVTLISKAFHYYFWPRYSVPRELKKLRYAIKKYKNQAGMNLTLPSPSQNSHAVGWHCRPTAESERRVAEIIITTHLLIIVTLSQKCCRGT